MSDSGTADEQDLLVDIVALKQAMERIMAGNTPDHAKWVSFKQIAQTHAAIAKRYHTLTGEEAGCYDVPRLKGWSDTVWPMQKEIFEGVYAELTRLEARLTRRGPKPPATGFEDLLHPEIKAVAIRHYLDGDYRNAVLDAVTGLFDLLRAKAGVNLDGDNLCNRAFSPDRPIIVLSELETESGRNDQRGFMDIFKGVYRGVRNPKAHSLVHDLDALKAGQYLVFVSLLARRLDEAVIIAQPRGE